MAGHKQGITLLLNGLQMMSNYTWNYVLSLSLQRFDNINKEVS